MGRCRSAATVFAKKCNSFNDKEELCPRLCPDPLALRGTAERAGSTHGARVVQRPLPLRRQKLALRVHEIDTVADGPNATAAQSAENSSASRK